MKKTWHVLREHVRPAHHKEWKTKIANTVSDWPSIILSPVYDEDLGFSLGMIDTYMTKEELHTWIRQRLLLSGLPDEYVLIPPVGWYRDPDYHEK